jgi:transcriptional regulator with XRE-family HTH domain
MHETMDETADTMAVAIRLRRARLAAGLELSDIGQRTRISPSILRWIDDGQFQRLPAGIYARSYIRAFAQAVGLDPAEILASLEHQLSPGTDIAEAEAKRAERASRVSPEWLRTAAAAVTDAALLSVLYGLVLGATAAVCGRPLADLLGPGLPALLVMVVLLTTIYFVVFAGVEGRTPGMRVFGLAPYYVSGPIRLQVIALRALRVFVAEASFGVELASRRSAPRDVTTAAPYGSRSTP